MRHIRRHTKDRALVIAEYYAENNSTILKTAAVLGIDKNIVYRALTEDISLVDAELALRVRKILDTNREESPGKASKTSKIVRAQRKKN